MTDETFNVPLMDEGKNEENSRRNDIAQDSVKVSIFKPFPDIRVGSRLFCESRGIREFQESSYIVIRGKRYNKIAVYNEIYRKFPQLMKFTEIVFKITSSVYFYDYVKESFPDDQYIALTTPVTYDDGRVPTDVENTDKPDKTFRIFWIRLNLFEVVSLVRALKGTDLNIYQKKIVEAIDRVTSKKLGQDNLKIFASILESLENSKIDIPIDEHQSQQSQQTPSA